MSTRIAYNTSQPHGSILAELVNETLEAVAKWKRMKAAVDSMAASADWSQVELEFGSEVGSGETLYNMITNVVTVVNVSDINNLAVLDQG